MRGGIDAARRPIIIVWGSAFLLAAAFALYETRPFQAGTLGYDSAASVLYFDRIATGRHLEAFLGATPKALLTVVFGLIHAVVPDWRAISFVAVGAYAAAIASTGALAFRLAGSVAAGFVTGGLLASTRLLQDVDLAYAVSWALLCLAAAGLLVSGSRPRYAWAGLALAVGGLARFEMLLVVGAGGAVLLVWWATHRRRASHGTVREQAPILLGLLALPIQMAHDFVLTGDPLYAEAVPVIGSVGHVVAGPATVLRHIGASSAAEPVVILLGLLGVWSLARRRAWPIVIAIGAWTVGVMAFLVFLAFRGILFSDRYLAPIDIALTFSAGIGVASLAAPTLAGITDVLRRPVGALAMRAAAGGLVAVALIRPLAPLDPATRSAIVANGATHRNMQQIVPAVGSLVAGDAAARTWPSDGSPKRSAGWEALVLVPVLDVPQLAVDLDLPLSAIGATDGSMIAPDGLHPMPGQIVFHDSRRDLPPASFRWLEVDRSTTVGSVRIEPILVDAAKRFWLVRIEAPG